MLPLPLINQFLPAYLLWFCPDKCSVIIIVEEENNLQKKMTWNGRSGSVKQQTSHFQEVQQDLIPFKVP